MGDRILYRIKNNEVNTRPRVGLAFEDWLIAYAVFMVKRHIYRGHESYLEFQYADGAPQAGVSQS